MPTSFSFFCELDVPKTTRARKWRRLGGFGDSAGEHAPATWTISPPACGIRGFQSRMEDGRPRPFHTSAGESPAAAQNLVHRTLFIAPASSNLLQRTCFSGQSSSPPAAVRFRSCQSACPTWHWLQNQSASGQDRLRTRPATGGCPERSGSWPRNREQSA